jgi:hypothetical protein
MEDLIRLLHSIWVNEEKMIVQAVKDIQDHKSDSQGDIKMAEVVYRLMLNRLETAENSYRQVREYLLGRGFVIDEEVAIKGLSYEELLNIEVVEIAEKFNLEKIYFDFLLNVSTKVTKKPPEELVVNDLMSIPTHYFRDNLQSNQIICDRINRFLEKLSDELKKRKEVTS